MDLRKMTPAELTAKTIKDIADRRRKKEKAMNRYVYESVMRARKK